LHANALTTRVDLPASGHTHPLAGPEAQLVAARGLALPLLECQNRTMPGELELLEEIRRFCITRALEAAGAARIHGSEAEIREAQRTLQILSEMQPSAMGRPSPAADAVEYLRSYAQRYRDHPDFKFDWTAALTDCPSGDPPGSHRG
jgi:hypothetical protein